MSATPHVPSIDHPNSMRFLGVLTLIDTPSDKAPSGARGHRVILTREAAENALHSLLGMPISYAPSLARHGGNKVGIITGADIARKELVIHGYLFAQNFPELVCRLLGRSIHAIGKKYRHRDSFGMSYEITNASVADQRARIWMLTRVTFTGAAILSRDKSAYRNTWIELDTLRAESKEG